MRRLIVALLMLMLVVAGCSGGSSGKPTGPPDPLPGDMLVFRVTPGSGGLMPSHIYLMNGPSLSIYGDGRVMVLDSDYPQIPRLMAGQLTPAEVAQFAADVSETGLIDSSKDYGDPPVEDAPGTAVLLNDGHGEVEISVSALGEDYGLSPTQREWRKELSNLIITAFELTETTPAIPDRVQVRSSSEKDDKARTPWPGPDPSTFMTASTDNAPYAAECGVLEGETAVLVYEEALMNDQHVWLVNGTPMMLVVRPLLPDEAGCE